VVTLRSHSIQDDESGDLLKVRMAEVRKESRELV
jgi:hypothetical protein